MLDERSIQRKTYYQRNTTENSRILKFGNDNYSKISLQISDYNKYGYRIEQFQYSR